MRIKSFIHELQERDHIRKEKDRLLANRPTLFAASSVDVDWIPVTPFDPCTPPASPLITSASAPSKAISQALFASAAAQEAVIKANAAINSSTGNASSTILISVTSTILISAGCALFAITHGGGGAIVVGITAAAAGVSLAASACGKQPENRALSSYGGADYYDHGQKKRV